MRFSPTLRKIATQAYYTLTEKPTTALGKKYNYMVRGHGPLDELHGYAWWTMTVKASEMWPLITCFAIYGVFASYIIWWNFQKTDVHFNRFSKYKPWEWERAQRVFDKRHKAFYDDSAMWQRIPELDKLQAEMLEEKNKRLAAQRATRHEHH